MKSIRWKLVIMYIALVFIVMLISGTFMISMLKEKEKDNIRWELGDYARQIIKEVIEPFLPDNPSDITLNTFQDTLLSLPKSGDSQLQAYIILYNRLIYRTVAATVTNDDNQYTDVITSTVIAASEGSESFGYSRKLVGNGADRPWYEFAIPYQTDDGNVHLIIYVRKDATQSNDNLMQITNIFTVSVVIALVFTAILGVFFASSLTVPISNLTHRAKELAKGNLSQKIDVHVKDEIGQLNESFNHMAFALSNMMSDIESEKSKMEVLVNNMTDGVLAYDDNGNLIHANSVCNDLLEMNNLEIMSFSDVLKLLKNDGIEASSNSDNRTLSIGDKYINASFNTYKNKDGIAGGVVIVLQDITKHMKLDNMRKEFVANVSHELRTPLTTIKGYAETLMNGVDLKSLNLDETGEKAIEFLQIIDNEADRMTSIVKDLLELSRFDNKQLDLRLEETDLIDLIKKTVKQNIVMASKINKSIIFDDPNIKMPVVIDTGRINQVLNNIITNSLKYSNENAVVNILVEEAESSYMIYIKDNGLGIPKEDLRRIFERFYRVDKARSREMGGTGLGLSIAKEIMEAHGGKIFCSSELGKGTTMMLRLPKDLKSLISEPDIP